ncbi:uncharacterized protein LOC108670408 [Hyalella azteca]|uniref:Uncharacterized protein LOC108670408 n=1 Tax=Hyalella azteca TaxID=294128 RepID=A0A8B7NJ66_HYAAZ|nr:uncharacterized protein LOC108670408 [Hyalella azteca]
MCLVFASYYPRQRLTECCSRPDIAMLLDTLGVTNMLNNEAVLSAFQLTSFNISTVDKERDAKRIDVMRNSSHAGETYSDLELSNYMRGMIISEPQELSGKSLLDFLNDGSLWQRESVVRLLQERLTSGQYEPYCTFHGRGMPKGMPKKAKYPHYIPYERPEEPCTPAGQGASRSGAPHGHAPSLLSDKVAFGSPITFHQDTAFHDSSTNRQHPYVYDLPASDDADSNTVNEHLSYQAGPSEADKHLLSSNAAHPHGLQDSPSKNHELFYNINTEPSHESGLEANFSPVPPLINNFDFNTAVTQRDPALQAEAEATAGRPHFRTAEQSVATTCSLYSLVAVLNLILLAF